MPFKTKKHKKNAKQRQISISEQGLASYSSRSVDIIEKYSNTNKINKSMVKVSYENYSYLRREMITILMISALIIGLQVFLKIINITI